MRANDFTSKTDDELLQFINQVIIHSQDKIHVAASILNRRIMERLVGAIANFERASNKAARWMICLTLVIAALTVVQILVTLLH